MKKVRIYDNDQLDAMKAKASADCAPRTCSADAPAINDVEEWRVACNWKNTDAEWDSTLKTVIAFAREGQRLRDGIKHLQKMSASEMRLQMGEMTASEIRLVRAITNALLAQPNDGIQR